MKDSFINRKKEVQIFQSILNFEVNTRILFIAGEAGMGKSSLLRKYTEICAQEKILISTYDYKGGADSPFTQLTKHITDLGVENFEMLKSSFVNIGIQFSNLGKKELFSSTDVQYALTGLDLPNRFSTLSEITDSFIAGLLNLLPKNKPIVFLLDSADLAGPVVKQWLVNDFFRIAKENQGVLVVVAGRSVIEPLLELQDYFTRIDLDGIELSEWEEYTKQLSLAVHPEFIHSIHDASKGNPAFMRQVLMAAAGTKK